MQYFIQTGKTHYYVQKFTFTKYLTTKSINLYKNDYKNRMLSCVYTLVCSKKNVKLNIYVKVNILVAVVCYEK